ALIGVKEGKRRLGEVDRSSRRIPIPGQRADIHVWIRWREEALQIGHQLVIWEFHRDPRRHNIEAKLPGPPARTSKRKEPGMTAPVSLRLWLCCLCTASTQALPRSRMQRNGSSRQANRETLSQSLAAIFVQSVQ